MHLICCPYPSGSWKQFGLQHAHWLSIQGKKATMTLRRLTVDISADGRHCDPTGMMGKGITAAAQLMDQNMLRKTLLKLQVLELKCGTVSRERMNALLSLIPNVHHLEIKIDRHAITNFRRGLREHCRQLRQLKLFTNDCFLRLPCLHSVVFGYEGSGPLALETLAINTALHEGTVALENASGPPARDQTAYTVRSELRRNCTLSLIHI